MMVNVYVVYGKGIGCHNECAHAYERAGAKVEIVHINQLLKGQLDLSNVQIINLAGGFLQGDNLGSAMCAANELECAKAMVNDEERRVKDLLIEFANKGNVIYGQCNGFQLLVKSGLLPGIGGDYSKQAMTLTNNDCGSYRVDFVHHIIERPHFAFEGIDYTDLFISIRHGEGKAVFYSPNGSITSEEGERNRLAVNEKHVLLRYADPVTHQKTEEFPKNPNGSVDGIAGLVNETGTIIGHMAHTEVGIYLSCDPRFFKMKDAWARQGISAASIDEKVAKGACMKVFENIVNHFN